MTRDEYVRKVAERLRELAPPLGAAVDHQGANVSTDRPVSAPDTVTDDMVQAYDDAEALGVVHNRGLTGWPLRAAAVRAGPEAVVPLIRAQVAGLVAVDPADLRTVLEARHWHSHQRPGVWDPDNPPERANKPCVECAARERLRAALAAAQEEASSR